MKKTAIQLLIRVFAATIMTVAPSSHSATSDGSTPEAIVRLAAETTEKICGHVPDSGWNIDASANASINAQLSGFLKKLSDMHATGNVGVSGGKYAGPLREQLNQTRSDTQHCGVTVNAQLLQYVQQTQKSEHVPESKRVSVSSVRLIPSAVNYPKQSAEEFAIWFIKLIDNGKYAQAYDNFAPRMQAMRSRDAFIQYMNEFASKCYPARSREDLPLLARLIPANQNMYQVDLYGYSFRTRFKNDERPSASTDANEGVSVVLSAAGHWQAEELGSTCLQQAFQNK